MTQAYDHDKRRPEPAMPLGGYRRAIPRDVLTGAPLDPTARIIRLRADPYATRDNGPHSPTPHKPHRRAAILPVLQLAEDGDDPLDILKEHQERVERLDRIERERARQEATQPRGACLHVILRLGDGDECVCVKCSQHMTDAEAQHYLESLAPSDKRKSLLERLQNANEAGDDDE